MGAVRGRGAGARSLACGVSGLAQERGSSWQSRRSQHHVPGAQESAFQVGPSISELEVVLAAALQGQACSCCVSRAAEFGTRRFTWTHGFQTKAT